MGFSCYKHDYTNFVMCNEHALHWMFKSPLSHLTKRDEKWNADLKTYFWGGVKKRRKKPQTAR